MSMLRVTAAAKQLRPLLPLSLRRTPRLPNLSPQLINCLQTKVLHHQVHNNTMSKSKPQSEPKPTPKWQSVSWQKKDQQFTRIPSQWRLPQLPPVNVTNYLGIPRECGLLTEKELDITENYDATALAKAIRERKLTCVEVTTAFCKVLLNQSRLRHG